MRGVGLKGSVIGSDTRACGVGLGWDSTRRCGPIPGCNGDIDVSFERVDRPACEIGGTVSHWLTLSWPLGCVRDCRARANLTGI